jgi:hypothetical protein
MDFNAKPGNCSTIQEDAQYGTQVLDEVFLKRYSDTEEVSKEFLKKWGKHPSDVMLYGDPSGNQHRSSSLKNNTDWKIVRNTLKPVFGDRLKSRVPKSPPSVRDSINSVNGRISSGRFRVDPKCKWMIRDLEGTERDESGDIVKKQGDLLTHLTDGIRYYIHKRYPVAGVCGKTVSLM